MNSLNSDLSSHFPTGMITQTNVSDTYRYAFSSGDDGYMYIDNVNLSTDEVTRLQFSKNGALDLLTINDGDLNYIGHFISDADLIAGQSELISCQPEKVTETDIVFDHSFANTPLVIATIFSSSANLKYKDLTLTVTGISKTGFKIRLYNGSDTAFEPMVNWIAVAN